MHMVAWGGGLFSFLKYDICEYGVGLVPFFNKKINKHNFKTLVS
jgi:hypothetical protein